MENLTIGQLTCVIGGPSRCIALGLPAVLRTPPARHGRRVSGPLFAVLFAPQGGEGTGHQLAIGQLEQESKGAGRSVGWDEDLGFAYLDLQSGVLVVASAPVFAGFVFWS